MADKNQQTIELEQRLRAQLNPDPNVGEKVLFTALCSLHIFNQGNAQSPLTKVGNGMVQILQDTKNRRHRLLIRNSHDLNQSLLNCYILPFGNLKVSSETRYQFDAIDYAETVSLKTYVINISNLSNKSAGTLFKNAYVQAYAANDKLLKEQHR